MASHASVRMASGLAAPSARPTEPGRGCFRRDFRTGLPQAGLAALDSANATDRTGPGSASARTSAPDNSSQASLPPKRLTNRGVCLDLRTGLLQPALAALDSARTADRTGPGNASTRTSAPDNSSQASPSRLLQNAPSRQAPHLTAPGPPAGILALLRCVATALPVSRPGYRPTPSRPVSPTSAGPPRAPPSPSRFPTASGEILPKPSPSVIRAVIRRASPREATRSG